MRFTITMPNGISKTRDCDDQSEIKILLKRGWKEVKAATQKTSKKKKGKK